MKLSKDDAIKLRHLALLSADAVYRGKRSTHSDISPWWSRDQFMDQPPLSKDPKALPVFLAEKDEAVRMWTEIDALAREIHFADPTTQEYAAVSARYPLDPYRIYRAGFQLAALGKATKRRSKNGSPSTTTPGPNTKGWKKNIPPARRSTSTKASSLSPPSAPSRKTASARWSMHSGRRRISRPLSPWLGIFLLSFRPNGRVASRPLLDPLSITLKPP